MYVLFYAWRINGMISKKELKGKNRNFFLLYEQQQLVTTSRLNDISKLSNLYVECEWSGDEREREREKSPIRFGRFLYKWSFRIWISCQHVCIKLLSIEFTTCTYAEVRAQQAHKSVCVNVREHDDFWPQQHIVWLTLIYSTTGYHKHRCEHKCVYGYGCVVTVSCADCVYAENSQIRTQLITAVALNNKFLC